VCIGDDGGVGCADGFDLVLGRLLQAPSRTHCLLGQALRSCGDVEEVSGAMGQKFPTDNSRGFRVNLATTSDTPSRLAKSLAKGEVTPNDQNPQPRRAKQGGHEYQQREIIGHFSREVSRALVSPQGKRWQKVALSRFRMKFSFARLPLPSLLMWRKRRGR